MKALRNKALGWGIGGGLAIIAALPAFAAQLAIIIDDLGYQPLPPQLAALPPEIGVSILPDTPYAHAIHQQARQQHRDILLHMPMEPSRKAPLEQTTLTKTMGKGELQLALKRALAQLPGAFAINNHMGSALTQDRQAMIWVMETLAEQQLAFLDSRTSAQSVAEAIAVQYHVPALRRHIFLDHQRTTDFISHQLRLAARKAQSQGYAVAIGHPYPVTLSALGQQLPAIADKYGITLVRLSSLYPAPPAKTDD